MAGIENSNSRRINMLLEKAYPRKRFEKEALADGELPEKGGKRVDKQFHINRNTGIKIHTSYFQ